MREIKFRLWNKREKKMVYSPDVNSDELLAIGLHGLPIAIYRSSFERKDEIIGWNVDHIYEVMQYAGIKDKNNVDVYEGDIVNSDYMWLESHIINFPNDYYMFCRYGIYQERIEVIGNIYENKELLEGYVNENN